MNRLITAKKGTGLDGLFNNYIPQQLEEKSVVKVEHSGLVSDVFNLYLAYLQDESCYSDDNLYLYARLHFGVADKIYERVKPVDADSLTAFLKAARICTNFEHQRALFSTFVDSLIQKSYDTGYNDFVIDNFQIPQNKNYQIMLDNLKGREQRPLHITIKTKNSRLYFGNITIIGDGLWHRRSGTEHCLFEVHGDLRSPNEFPPYGDGAKYCTYVHHGRLYLKEPDEPSAFDIPDHCVFKTSNRKTARKLQKIVRRFPQMPYKSITPSAYSNKIYFIDSKGEEHLQ